MVALGFGAYAKKGNALNAAYRFNSPHAFTPAGQLDLSALVYSRGNIATPNCPAVSALPGQITFRWLAEMRSQYNQATDLATFVAYIATQDRFVFKMDGATRAELTYTLPLPGVGAGDKVYGYMSFANASGKLRGNSVCAGMLEFSF